MRIAKIKIPIEIPLRLEKDNCAPNWDQRFGAFAFFDDKMIEPCFSSLPVELNATTPSWLKVLKSTKKMQGECAWDAFDCWSHKNYEHNGPNRNREFQEKVTEEELNQMINPASIFLENC